MSTTPHVGHRCPSCTAEVLAVSIEMGDGQVLYRTCLTCELRWWEKDGMSVSREAALARIPRR
jgi:hypothetical protein